MMAGSLEAALRRAALWTSRGLPTSGAGLLAGSEGRLRFRPQTGDLHALLPGGEEISVSLSTRNERVLIARVDGGYRITASADLPPHLVERTG
jgi:hypothetical protein